MMHSNYGSSSINQSGMTGSQIGFSYQNSQRDLNKQIGFYQGIDFDEVNGVNTFPFKLNASFAFTSAGGQQGQEFVVMFLNLNERFFQITVEAYEDRALFLVEDKYDITSWKGEFSRTYIEEITRKTGREKSYGQFLALIG